MPVGSDSSTVGCAHSSSRGRVIKNLKGVTDTESAVTESSEYNLEGVVTVRFIHSSLFREAGLIDASPSRQSIVLQTGFLLTGIIFVLVSALFIVYSSL